MQIFNCRLKILYVFQLTASFFRLFSVYIILDILYNILVLPRPLLPHLSERAHSPAALYMSCLDSVHPVGTRGARYQVERSWRNVYCYAGGDYLSIWFCCLWGDRHADIFIKCHSGLLDQINSYNPLAPNPKIIKMRFNMRPPFLLVLQNIQLNGFETRHYLMKLFRNSSFLRCFEILYSLNVRLDNGR